MKLKDSGETVRVKPPTLHIMNGLQEGREPEIELLYTPFFTTCSASVTVFFSCHLHFIYFNASIVIFPPSSLASPFSTFTILHPPSPLRRRLHQRLTYPCG
ncbi:hypothetical protein E2C01_037408 [Portunus trituberculatus]|uniref:Uncharacterized protein n=1 Tax=Portunus trituberculatus TaxID=210409 RepID=A0A5B7FDX2_PORTR|nr:hypothetical protein [Portunus trituberculatus]